LQVLTLAFTFTLIVDLLAAVALFVAEIIIVQAQARQK